MNCFSRSTFGVFIGILNILIYIFASFAILSNLSHSYEEENYYTELEKQQAERDSLILCTILSVFLIMTLISGVLIVGIVKRLHKLMMPWLIISGLGFICDCARLVMLIVMGVANGLTFPIILYLFFLGLLRCGLEALIIWPIYTLWRDIREKSEAKTVNIVENGVQYDPPPAYNYYGFVQQKS